MIIDTPRTPAGRDALAAILAAPADCLLATDFDGVLSPIIDNPDEAYADPEVLAALSRLGQRLGAIVVITGRPVRSVIDLAGPGDHAGLARLVVLGQYGVERWDAATDTITEPPPPPGIDHVRSALPGLVQRLGLVGVRLEDKGRAIGVHTRTAADPDGALAALQAPVHALAAEHGLHVEPGKFVWEIRAAGLDKGHALAGILAETGLSGGIVYLGDDLGDVPAFDRLATLRAAGRPTVGVCSASAEQDALVALADVVVDGVPGVRDWLTALADTLDRTGRRSPAP